MVTPGKGAQTIDAGVRAIPRPKIGTWGTPFRAELNAGKAKEFALPRLGGDPY
jgi:hypothetical protein